MTRWVVLVPSGSEITGYALEQDRLIAKVSAPSEREALDRLGDPMRIFRLGDGPSDSLPTAILPKQGTCLPALEQTNPPDIVSATVRLWIVGALADCPHWDGVVCASHQDVNHWIHVSAGEAISTQSVLTSRLITALNGAVTADAEAVADTLSRPERLAAHLRQAEVSGNRAAITGHLLGAELAATRPFWLGQEVLLIDAASDPRAHVLKAQGVPVTVLNIDALVATALAEIGRTCFGAAD